MNLRLEPIEHSADDRRANRLQKLLGSLDFVEIGASGADDQKDGVYHASEEQRIVGRQDRRRVQEYEAELPRDGFECRAGLRPVHSSQRQGRFAAGAHEAHLFGFRRLDRSMADRLASFDLTEKDLNEPGALVPPDRRR